MWDAGWPRAGSPKLRMHVDKCTFGDGRKQMCFVVVCCFQLNILLLSFYIPSPPSNRDSHSGENGQREDGFVESLRRAIQRSKKKKKMEEKKKRRTSFQPVSFLASSVLLFLLNASVVFWLHCLAALVWTPHIHNLFC